MKNNDKNDKNRQIFFFYFESYFHTKISYIVKNLRINFFFQETSMFLLHSGILSSILLPCCAAVPEINQTKVLGKYLLFIYFNLRCSIYYILFYFILFLSLTFLYFIYSNDFVFVFDSVYSYVLVFCFIDLINFNLYHLILFINFNLHYYLYCLSF